MLVHARLPEQRARVRIHGVGGGLRVAEVHGVAPVARGATLIAVRTVWAALKVQ